jgi:hypothetical protein
MYEKNPNDISSGFLKIVKSYLQEYLLLLPYKMVHTTIEYARQIGCDLLSGLAPLLLPYKTMFTTIVDEFNHAFYG